MARWQNGGSILLYSSIAGDSVQKKSPNEFHAWSAYATAKGAVHQLTRSMAVELAKMKIRVNSISPGQLWTPSVVIILLLSVMIGLSSMSGQYLEGNPALQKHWSENNNPMGRLGRTDEVRGATVTMFIKTIVLIDATSRSSCARLHLLVNIYFFPRRRLTPATQTSLVLTSE